MAKKKKKSFSIPAGRRLSYKTQTDGQILASVVERYAGNLATPLALLGVLPKADASVKTASGQIAVNHLAKKYLP
tara:strand:- start:341 stop:565 length:225 start_codon:yes stop_codon:yes gene_type:complete